jgi:hypothetical protein
MNDLSNTSQEIILGTYTPVADKKELAQFNQYFFDRKYDAYAVDKCTGGNILYFTLVYSFMKLEWNSNIPSINE